MTKVAATTAVAAAKKTQQHKINPSLYDDFCIRFQPQL